MKELIIYCSVFIAFGLSLYYNIQDTKEINRLKSGINTLEELPFLKKIVDVTSYQHFFEGKHIDIPSIDSTTTKLCIFYLSTMCEACIQASLEDLNQISELINPNDIYVITDYTKKRDLTFMKSVLREKRVKLLSMSDIDLDKSFFDLMTANIPLLFVVDKDKVVKVPSLHIKEVPKYNQKYYETVKEMFFNK